MIAAGWCTLEELRTTWSPVDLVEANIALDELEHAKALANPPPPKK